MKQTILAADDSKTIQKIIKKELSTSGYEVIFAQNGIEALAILEWADPLPDLIALDIDMPRMNGLEALERIRHENNHHLARIPVIFISANDSAENRVKGYKLGVIDFISKPFPPGKISETVNSILHCEERYPDMRALIVEDSSSIRGILKQILMQHKIQVTEAQSGKEAWELLQKEEKSFDLVVTDYTMPDMNGEELCKNIRTRKDTQNIPVFFVSSSKSEEIILRFFKAGANDYLPKPFFKEEFRARILTHLRNRAHIKQLEQLNAQLAYQADHDALTGIHNRGFFTRKLTEYFSTARIKNTHLCCLLFDLDHFKDINDTYGHGVGDLVLKEFAHIIRTACTRKHLEARYGGEEFALLLPETPLEKARNIAERIRRRTDRHIFTKAPPGLHVTTSIGIASLKDHRPEQPDRLLVMADDSLYSAKSAGRNTLMVYGEKRIQEDPD